MSRNCIGLDIGSSSVKAVQVKKSKRGIELLAFGMEPLPPQTIVDGTIMDQGAVAEGIRNLWGRLKLRGKDVAIAIAGHSVIIKKIAVPPMSRGELEEQIPYEAERHIPFAKDDVEIDYEVTNPMSPAGQMELLLVAAKKEVVQDYLAVVRESGLNPVVVDVGAFTVQNAFEANYDLGPGETIVIINIGAAISNINIVRGNTSLFTRDVTIGGNAFTEEIQKQLNVSADEAEAYKVGGAYNEHGVVPQEVERIIAGVAEVMAGEFQRSLDFFLATTADTDVSKICMAGGTAKVTALHRAIERRSRLTVEVCDAWRRVAVDPRLDAAYLGAHSPEDMVGLGLALRAANDK
jgi:type IV pilus assembly protein PilM